MCLVLRLSLFYLSGSCKALLRGYVSQSMQSWVCTVHVTWVMGIVVVHVVCLYWGSKRLVFATIVLISDGLDQYQQFVVICAVLVSDWYRSVHVNQSLCRADLESVYLLTPARCNLQTQDWKVKYLLFLYVVIYLKVYYLYIGS